MKSSCFRNISHVDRNAKNTNRPSVTGTAFQKLIRTRPLENVSSDERILPSSSNLRGDVIEVHYIKLVWGCVHLFVDIVKTDMSCEVKGDWKNILKQLEGLQTIRVNRRMNTILPCKTSRFTAIVKVSD